MAENIPLNIYNVLGDTNVKQKMTQVLRNTQSSITEEDKLAGIKVRYFAR